VEPDIVADIGQLAALVEIAFGKALAAPILFQPSI
jgi:hypothetical protein